MIVDLSQDGEWFTFFGSKLSADGETVYEDPLPDAGRVCIRRPTKYVEGLQGKRKRKVEHVLNPKTRQMERIEFEESPTPEEARQERGDAWDFMIVAWENIFDAQGVAIPCTRENKLELMAIPVFDRFVARCLQLLAESGVKAAEEERKN